MKIQLDLDFNKLFIYIIALLILFLFTKINNLSNT